VDFIQDQLALASPHRLNASSSGRRAPQAGFIYDSSVPIFASELV